MKKKLEADLISIAHRILQLKNKSDINQLYLETQKLYEKLSVLRFVEEHFGDVKPTIGTIEIEKQIEQAFAKEELTQPEPIIVIDEVKEEVAVETPLEQNTEITGILQPATNIVVDDVISEEEEVTETPIDEEEEIEELVTDGEILTDEATEPETAPFIPAFNLEPEEDTEIEEPKKEEIQLEAPKKNEVVQISFEDLLGGNYHDTQFVKVQQIENIPTTIVIETPKKIDSEAEITARIPEETPDNNEPKAASLNEKLAKNINIDLNDRIAFTKHLFGNSSEDYNRVLNQLITFDTFYETRDFILDMVKPDYNNWEGKQDYEERFMDIIEKKFL
ncbi:hypothetical protein [Flavobacterium xinjiangense]|uniref:Uncharacterized protein n=1 Tax=Flavobacterium xinjiangense TaxID=178356 RepID=A0A1M7LLX0_9FLAO|nr:hypothetical protein [Flavobacterium xinjiangense]SHM78999.1 hypothetical protein SAMN05216269_10745 [Flavobacterium xinjiangense]